MQEDNNLKNSILEKIKKDNVKMTSKQFFVMKWVTLLITSVFFLLLAIYIFAYITFLFVDNGLMYIPVFSQSGLVNFIIEIPWTLVGLGMISLFLFSVTSKTFYKIYRKPFVTFFLTILIIIMLSHIIFVESGAMQYLKMQAYKDHLQLVPSKFLDFRSSQTGDLFVGYVVATSSNSVTIRDRQNNLLEIYVADTLNLNDFLIGKQINAYGVNDNGRITAKSIEIVQ